MRLGISIICDRFAPLTTSSLIGTGEILYLFFHVTAENLIKRMKQRSKNITTAFLSPSTIITNKKVKPTDDMLYFTHTQ
jgi:hypothetical protein